jgi:hypothetical protein
MRFTDFNIINESTEPDIIRALRDFLPIAVKELKLKRLPKIKFLSKLDNEDQPTFGTFSHDGANAMIQLNIMNRHPVDVLRTLAHELVHYKQFVHKQLGPKSGDTGSSSENEAHVIAGIIMRHFDKKYPGYLSSKNISDDATADFNENTTSPHTAAMSVERALDYLRNFSKTTTGFELSYNSSHFNRRLNDKRNEAPITGFDLKRTLKEFLKVWRNELPALKVNTQIVVHDPSTSLWIPIFIGVENGAKNLILKTIMKGKHYATQDDIVTITHDAPVSESRSKDLKLAKSLEDYANKNIPHSEPGFGDFMYHAELIRKGHQDVHKQDLSTVQKKYRTIMNDMIKKHLNENMDHTKDSRAVDELKAALMSHKDKLQGKDGAAVYKIIDQLMTRVAKSHGLTGQQMHDMWVDRYKEIPDTWIMNEAEEGNLLSPGNTVGFNVFELPADERSALNGTTVFHQTRKLAQVLKSGALKPRADASGTTSFAINAIRAGRDFQAPKGIFVSQSPNNWYGEDIAFKILPSDKLYRAYYPEGHLMLINTVPVSRFLDLRGDIEEAIAPHGSPENEFKMMQAGNKPAALVDPTYFKKLYKKTADTNHWPYFQVSIPGQKYGNIVVGLPGQEKRIHRIAELVSDMNVNFMGQGIKPDAAYHRELGTLLGYNESDIQEFLKKMNLDEDENNTVRYKKISTKPDNRTMMQKLVGDVFGSVNRAVYYFNDGLWYEHDVNGRSTTASETRKIVYHNLLQDKFYYTRLKYPKFKENP